MLSQVQDNNICFFLAEDCFDEGDFFKEIPFLESECLLLITWSFAPSVSPVPLLATHQHTSISITHLLPLHLQYWPLTHSFFDRPHVLLIHLRFALSRSTHFRKYNINNISPAGNLKSQYISRGYDTVFLKERFFFEDTLS